MAVTSSTDQDFKNQIQNRPQVVVKYFADWCGTCKLFSPKFRRISEDEKYKDILFLDVNAEENQEARKLAGVDNLPFFATFKNGKLLEGNATSKEEVLLDMINKLQS